MSPRSCAWLKPLGRQAAGLLASAGLAFTLAAPALAIPEADAIKKLAVVPVFVITDANGVPLPIPQEKQLVLPLYLESAKANQELAALNKSNPSLKAGVVALPLNVMNEKVVVAPACGTRSGKTPIRRSALAFMRGWEGTRRIPPPNQSLIKY